MRSKFLCNAGLMLIATATAWTTEARAVLVQGGVRDQGVSRPANGVSGAKVQLRDKKGGLTNTVITDADGRYEIPGVEEGEYTLIVTKVGYIPHPLELTSVKVGGLREFDDVELMRENGDDSYYANVADSIVRLALSVPEPVAVEKKSRRDLELSYQWDRLRAIDLPPSSKARLAVQLSKQYERAHEVLPDLSAYMAASPDQIAAAQEVFSQAMAGKAEFPGKVQLEQFKLGPEIIADMVLHQSRTTSESAERRKQFVDEFLAKWKDTPAAKRYLETAGIRQFYFSVPNSEK